MSPVYINGVEQVVAHAAKHQDTGADEVSVAALSGELADRQPSKAGTSVLGWTNQKLLKGAGAGANPTEIDVPSGGATIVRKTADETVNNSTVLQNDDHLFFAMGANEVWKLEVGFIVEDSGVANFKFGIALPGGATKAEILIRRAADGTYGIIIMGGGASVDLGGIGVGLPRMTGVWFLVITNGGAAGNVQIQWAQYTANASNTILKANSYIIAQKLA